MNRPLHATPDEGAPALVDTSSALALLARLLAPRIVSTVPARGEAARDAAVGRLRHALVAGGASVSETAAATDRFGDALADECRRIAAATKGAA